MEFFNDLSKRFSSVAKSVTEKTKDSVEVTRLASDLRIQNNALEQLYTELGKVCYALRMGEGDSEQAEALSERIQRVRARIDELTAQRDAIRDVRRCPACGAVMAREARFCSACGKRMPEDAPQTEDKGPGDAEYCPDCGAQRKPGEKFCTVCGKSFEPAEAPDPEEVEVVETVTMNTEEPEAFDANAME